MLTISVPIKSVLLIVLFLQCVSSISLPNHLQSMSNALIFGDARFINGGSSAVKLTDPDEENPSPSSGILIWAKPIKFLSPNPVSFFTDFTFVIPRDDAVKLAFVILSSDFLSRFSRESPNVFSKESRLFEVEFGTLVDGNVNKSFGVSVKSLISSKLSSVSRKSSILNDGGRLHSWIDYDSSSKRIEVRLGRFGAAKPYDPLLEFQVDLGRMWMEEKVLMGLSSSGEKYLQSAVVHSWNFRALNVPKGLHSQPVNSLLLSNESDEKEKTESKKRNCLLRFLSGLIFVTGCGTLVAFVVLSLWAFFTRNNEAVIPSTCLMYRGDVRYKKINVVVEDGKDDVKSWSF